MPGAGLRARFVPATDARPAMPIGGSDNDPERALRFRDAALPHLDDVYTLARHLLRDSADAEDAVQECYLRALKHFDSYRGPAMKPWLLAILRNVCRAEFARRASSATAPIDDVPDDADRTPLWHETQDTPETQVLRHRDATAIQRLVTDPAEPSREHVVLREHQTESRRRV